MFVTYFSYGSNMSRRRLASRTPSAQPIGIARLYGHRLEFHKIGKDGTAKCDAFESGVASDCVIGVLFQLHLSQKAILDEIEGVGRGYAQKMVSLVTAEEEAFEAFTYCATAIDATLKPYRWYKEHVLRGARENRLPEAYVRMIEAVAVIEDDDSARHEWELSIYN